MLNRDRQTDVAEGECPRTAVLLCTDVQSSGYGLDIAQVGEWIRDTVPAVHVSLVPNLGQSPQRIGKAVETSGADRLVLGLCSGKYSTSRIQAQARKVGLDPLGIETVNLGAYASTAFPRHRATERAKAILAAAVSRARAFPGSEPENLVPHLPSRFDRRSLFSLPLVDYRLVPSIVQGRCVASSGCELCVQACPLGALVRADDRIALEAPRCQSCGICLGACPVDAVRFPGYTASQLGHQISSLLDPASGDFQRRAVLFVCERNATTLEELAWESSEMPGPQSRHSVTGPMQGAGGTELLSVQVPCLSMLSPSWMLACLTMGAAAARLVSCAVHCPLGQAHLIRGRVEYCREWLQQVGDSPERVALLPLAGRREQWSWDIKEQAAAPIGLSPARPHAGKSNLTPMSFGPRNAVAVLQRLVEENGGEAGASLAHASSPFGLVAVTDGCTGCGVCAVACPTGALAMDRGEDALALTFEASLCTACGLCLPRCPEVDRHVLELQRVTDMRRLSQGRVTPHSSRHVRCVACGAPIACEAMLGRMESALGGQYAAALQVITHYCPDCRMLSGSAKAAAPGCQDPGEHRLA